MNIPKVIHYCWFGKNPLPSLAIKCIESWEKYFPDYELKEWNEDNFDVNLIPYIRDAYAAKRYAFVSDYARFWILYHEGGLYFDTDVEVLKPMNDIIVKGPFMGREKGGTACPIAPGLGLGVNVGHVLYKELLDYYTTFEFILPNGAYNKKTIVEHTTEFLKKYGLTLNNELEEVKGVWMYPTEYFCPLDYTTGELKITDNTYTIHHYMASWVSKSESLYKRLAQIIGKNNTHRLAKLLKTLKIIK